jgi:hypothetical protein
MRAPGFREASSGLFAADNQARKGLAEKKIYLKETVSPEEMRAELSELCK